jgi:uncharacterized membrane protein
MNNDSDRQSDADVSSNKQRPRQTQISEPTQAYNDSFIRSQPTQELSQRAAAPVLTDSKQRSLVGYNHITYLLYVLSYFTAGLLWIVPIVMNYVKRHDADRTWLATHFDWQIKTFWYSIVGFVIGSTILLSALGVFGAGIFAESNNMAFGSFFLAGLGLFIIGISFIWHLYRIIRGWIALTDNRPVP